MNPGGKRGFTLVELSVVLALFAVLAGLVVARYDLVGTPRQRTIAAARSLGNMIQTFRERAMAEENLYAVRIIPETGDYSILKPEERSAEAVERAMPIRKGKIEAPVRMGKVRHKETELASPVTIFLDPSGILPELSIEVSHQGGSVVYVNLDSLVNEVAYVAR